MSEFEETLTVDGEKVTIEVEVDGEYTSSTQRQTVSTSPGSEVTIRVEEE